MSENGLLTDSMLAKELGVGQATLKFWLNRFNRWLPYTMKNGKKWYHPTLITPLILIADHFSTGMLPSDIESALNAHAADNAPSHFQADPSHHPHAPSSPHDDGTGSNEAPDLLSALTAHQERIAIAQERRAVAEERKAEALLKRAEAETLKAQAFDHLADAIKNAVTSALSGKLSGQDRHPPPHETDDPIVEEDNSIQKEKNTTIQETDNNTASSPADAMGDTVHQDEDIKALPSDSYEAAFDQDETNPILQGLEDLSQLIHDDDHISPPDATNHESPENGNEKDFNKKDKTNNENNENETPPPIDLNASEIDDLSALIESDSSMMGIDEGEEDLDDLFSLIANEEEKDGAHDMLHDMPDISGDMDDLASLIDDHHDTSSLDLLSTPEGDLSKFNEDDNDNLPGKDIDHSENDHDDFSDLIDFNEDETDDLSSLLSEEEMDDLSSLIDTAPQKQEESIDDPETMDDLFALIEAPPSPDGEMDDLSALIEAPPSPDGEMDDLSALIEEPLSPDGEMDDLSALINEPFPQNNQNKNETQMDDLASLIDSNEEDVPTQSEAQKEDLSSTLDNNREKSTKKQSPKIKKPTVSFDENFAQFKSEVINIIIKLKKEGYTIEETTDLLNEEKITTLSGKNRWSKKMIGKIYTFIEAAAK